MRDDIQSSSNWNATIDYHNLDRDFVIYDWVVLNGSEITRESYRSDSTPTTKVGGSYVESTNYEAYFAEAKPNYYDYWDANPSKPYKVYHNKGIARVGKSLPYGMSYGCQHSRPYIPSIPAWLISETESAVISKVRHNQFNLGTALGELPETIQFIGTTLSSAGRLFHAIKHRNAKAAADVISDYFGQRHKKGVSRSFPRKIPKALPSAYLQYQFAWKPMMSDIHNSLELLSEGLADPYSLFVRVNKKDPTYQLPYNPPDLVTGTVKRGVEVGVGYAIADQTRFDLERLGLVNPLAVAWELVPLSFVFDWFLPVGDMLSALTIGFGTTFKTGYTTLWLDNDFSYSTQSESYLKGENPKVEFRTRSMKRTLLSSWPIPVPHFHMNLSMGKIISGLALIAASRS